MPAVPLLALVLFSASVRQVLWSLRVFNHFTLKLLLAIYRPEDA